MNIMPRLMLVLAATALLVLSAQAGPPDGSSGSVLDATYTIEKQEVHLIGGRAEMRAAPGSAIKITTRVVGEPVYGDLDGDGRDDAALFLVHDPGGSGTFYYVTAAIAKDNIYQGTNAVLLGDRITLLTIHIRSGVIIADYADRRPDESMAISPSIAKTLCLTLQEGRLEAIKAP